MRRAASGRASRADGRRHLVETAGVGEQLLDDVRERPGLELGVLDHQRRAGLGHPGGVGMLVARGRVRIGDEDRGPPGRGQLEHRAAGTGEHQVARGERLGQVRLVLEQGEPLWPPSGIKPLAGQRIVAVPRDLDHVVLALRGRAVAEESVERADVDRPGALATAEDEQAAPIGRDAEAPPGFLPAGGRDPGGHRATGDHIAIALPALDRECETDAARAAGEQPVGEPEVPIGLGEDQGPAGGQRREPTWPRHVSPTAHHRIGAAATQGLPRGRNRRRRERRRPGGLQRSAAIESPEPQEIDLVPGGRDQVGLQPIAGAQEGDFSTAIP